MLSNTYSEVAISEKTCHEWFQRFKNGDFDVQGHALYLVGPARRVVYYELLKPIETITDDRYRTQLMRLSRALKDKRS